MAKKKFIIFSIMTVFCFSFLSVSYSYSPGNVQVTVKDYDNSSILLSGALVEMNPGKYSGTTDDNGTLTFTNIIPYRNYSVEVTLDGYVEGTYGQGRTGFIWVETGQTAIVSIPLVKKSTIQGQITHNSTGIGNAMVVLLRPPILQAMYGEVPEDEFVNSTLTDTGGNYLFPAVAAGDYIIRVLAHNYYTSSPVTFTVGTDEVVIKNVTLTPGTTVLSFYVNNVRNYYGRTATFDVVPWPGNDNYLNKYMAVTDMPPGAEAPIEETGAMTPSLPGIYTVAYAMTDLNGVASLDVGMFIMTNFATEAHPSVIPGPSVLPLIYDNQVYPNSSGTARVQPGEEVYLRGWGRDFNLNSPEMFNTQAFEWNNAIHGLFDIYGNKNGDWGQSEFSFAWSLRDKLGTDKTYLLSSTSTQNVNFQVPPTAAAGDEFIATLQVTGDYGLAGDSKDITIYVDSLATTGGPNNTCANSCHSTIQPTFINTKHYTLAGVDCQACHGPGNNHQGGGGYMPPPTHWPGNCGQCHTQFAQWQKSRHSDPTAFGHAEIASDTSYGLLSNCYKCHYSDGYIGAVESPTPFKWFSYSVASPPAYIPEDTPNVSCDMCHDPHDETNPVGLRTWNDTGYPCQTCHEKKWQNATYTATGDEIGNAYHWNDYSQYQGAYDNQTLTGNPHTQVKDCATCHMAQDITDTDASGVRKVGGHTMRMRDVGPDGDPGTGDDLLNIVVCQGCHPGLTTFDRNGVRTRIKNKLNQLGNMLKADNHDFFPPFQPGKCAKCHKGGSLPFINDSELRAYENAYLDYKLVLHDRSFGIHNPGYIERLLDDSITGMQEAFICPPDLDCDRKVDIFDLLTMKNEYGRNDCAADNATFCCQADIDTTGTSVNKVDIFDLLLMKIHYSRTTCDPCIAPCSTL